MLRGSSISIYVHRRRADMVFICMRRRVFLIYGPFPMQLMMMMKRAVKATVLSILANNVRVQRIARAHTFTSHTKNVVFELCQRPSIRLSIHKSMLF